MSSIIDPHGENRDAEFPERDEQPSSEFLAPRERDDTSISIPVVDESDDESANADVDSDAQNEPEAPTFDDGAGRQSTTIEMDVHPTIDLGEGDADESVPSDEPTMLSPSSQTKTVALSKPRLPAPPDDGLTVGEMFGQFRVVRYIGGGGMGRVYEAFDCDLERAVAIKVLPKKRAADETVVARFLNEAKSSARLNHENIAQVYLFGNYAGIPFIAFEYVEGVNLRDYVRNHGALTLNDAIDYVLQTAMALSHAMSHGVTHRDVKPSNILVTPQKRVKLIDMGLARLLRPDSGDELTESGVTLGTFDYISPEQAKDPRLADVRSDVYSLGCTFYYILTGSPPFPNGTVLQKLLQHQGDEAPDVRGLNPSIPAEIAAILKKMMQKNPDDRYQTPDLLISDLLQVVDMLGLNISERGYAEASSSLKSSTTIPPRAIPAIVVLLGFVAIVAVMYLLGTVDDLTLPVVEPPIAASNPTPQGNQVASADNDANSSGAGGATSNPTTQSPETSNGATNGGTAATRANAGRWFESEGTDFLYATSYGSTLEKTPALLTDEPREELREYLSDSHSVASDNRVAFGWNVAAISALPDSADNDAQLSFVANVVETTLGGGADGSSHSFSAYSLLGTAADSSPSTFVAETLRIVDGRGEEPNTYATLQAALNDPADETGAPTLVELKFEDSMEVAPISLVDRDVEIRAADGYRPTLVFKLSESSDGGWGQRMFLLDASRLVLEGVNIDFTVPAQEIVASEWSVFEALGASELSIRESIVTVCNMTGSSFTAPLHSNVAFFRASDDSILDPVFDSGQSERVPENLNVFNVQLDGVLARGEATLFNVVKPGGRYEARNSGFNISGPFLHYSESDVSTSDSELRFTLDLDHVAVVGRSCLVRVDSEALDFTRLIGQGNDESRPDDGAGMGTVQRNGTTRRLPRFEVRGTNSIISLDNQSLAFVTSPALVDLALFENQWLLDGLITLDLASFWRRRANRSEQWRDYEFDPARYNSQSVSLADLNGDAYKRLESIPPHLFSAYDFSNWILNPIHTASNLSELSRGIGDDVKKNFVDIFFD
jgi:serine/threonine protein kinase